VPALGNPLLDASVLEITGRNEGRIAVAGGYGSHGETIRCVRKKSGAIAELWLAATRLVPEGTLAAELEARYATGTAAASRPRQRQRPARAD
jgi:hypothetical protein